jgi:hypothetical protein
MIIDEHFDTVKAVIKPELMPFIEQGADMLKKKLGLKVSVKGYDNVGQPRPTSSSPRPGRSLAGQGLRAMDIRS